MVEIEYSRYLPGLNHDVGNIIWMDSGDFLDECQGFRVRDCFRVVKNVRSFLINTL